MKKFVLSAAVLAIFTGGMTAAVSFTAPPEASACSYDANNNRSDALARSLPQVKQGDKGKHVLALQLALRKEGYSYLRGTGTYASETLRAVKEFQRKHSIKASGIVGSKTWHALVGPKSPGSTGGAPGSMEVITLQPGERNADKVAILVNMLYRIHPYANNVESLWGQKIYGPEMQKMVRDFQKRAGIKASGIVGPQTVRAMDTVIAVAGNWGC